jgi:hypothetical protein
MLPPTPPDQPDLGRPYQCAVAAPPAISAKLPEITSILDMAVGMFVKKRTKRNTNFSNQTGNINAN